MGEVVGAYENQHQRKRPFRRFTIAISAVVLASCGSTDSDTEGVAPRSSSEPSASEPTVEVPESTAPSSPVATSDRGSPGQLDDYLGLTITPDETAALEAPNFDELDACVAASGFTYETPNVEFDPLLTDRILDPVGFGDTYGYGYFQLDIARIESAPESIPSLPPVTRPSGYDEALIQCQDEHPYRMEAVMPEAEVLNRAFELTGEFEVSDAEYVSARANWAVCMTQSGIVVTTDADVKALLAESLEPYAIPADESQESTETPWIISPGELDQLVAFEREVYGKDMTCRDSSGLIAAEIRIEQQVIEILVSEFGFAGATLP